MSSYLVLLRGINVGGKNMVPMAALRLCLETMGFLNVSTYIASGNVLLDSDKDRKEIKAKIEDGLVQNFKLDSKLIKVLVLSQSELAQMINDKPEGFGDLSDKYYSDAIFLIDIDPVHALSVFNPKEGVDKIWLGKGIIYSQRLSTLRTMSRLNSIMGTPVYQSMTIRSWKTAVQLLALMHARQAK